MSQPTALSHVNHSVVVRGMMCRNSLPTIKLPARRTLSLNFINNYELDGCLQLQEAGLDLFGWYLELQLL